MSESTGNLNETRNSLVFLRLILLVIIILELFIFASNSFFVLVIFILIFGGFGLILRYKFKDKEEKPWEIIKHNLITILENNHILMPDIDTPQEHMYFQSIEPITLIDYEHTFIKYDQEVVGELRFIGVDGILICLFLLKIEPNFCSPKTIVKSLPIPKTTVYRNIKRLLERNYLNTKQTLEDPKRVYYQLTVDGKYLVYDLYKIIKY